MKRHILNFGKELPDDDEIDEVVFSFSRVDFTSRGWRRVKSIVIHAPRAYIPESRVGHLTYEAILWYLPMLEKVSGRFPIKSVFSSTRDCCDGIIDVFDSISANRLASKFAKSGLSPRIYVGEGPIEAGALRRLAKVLLLNEYREFFPLRQVPDDILLRISQYFREMERLGAA